jgi:2-haloacid dehalogenase
MLDFSHFKILTFDCYGTLIDWETGILSALRPILAAYGKSLSDVQILEFYSDLEAAAEQGEFQPYREVLQTVVRGFGQRLGFEPSDAEVRSLPESLANWTPFSDTVAALRQLKTRYRLAIISNIDDDLFAHSAPKLEVAFDFVVTAQQARAYKPSPKIFQLAEQGIGIPRSQWLHVGQSIYHDVIPAKSLGITTVWVNRPSPRPNAGAAKAASGQPDLEAPDLKTLARLAVAYTASRPA